MRGVSIDRLPTILATGVDVEPSTDPIYVDDFEKAWEYGDFPKVLLAYTWDGLEQTFRTPPADAPAAELAALRRVYPHEYPDPNGRADRLWLSRIDDPNPARRHYELAYARWIPGDPFVPLKGVFIFGERADVERVTAQMS